MPLIYSSFMTFYFSFLALSCQLFSITPCLAIKYLCFLNFKLNTKIMHLPTSFLPFNLFFTPILSLFLLHFPYFLSPCFSKILVAVPRHAYLLEVLPAISFLVVFVSFSQLFPSLFLKFGI